MSIPVKIEDLATTLEDFDIAYLLTVGERGIKVVCVDVQADSAGLKIPTSSKGASRNLELNNAVTLMCPPRQPRGFTLLVDGTAAAEGDGFRVTPTGAVLHRPASHADGPVGSDSCSNDCKPVGSA
jgi:hypothetical protein